MKIKTAVFLSLFFVRPALAESVMVDSAPSMNETGSHQVQQYNGFLTGYSCFCHK